MQFRNLVERRGKSSGSKERKPNAIEQHKAAERERQQAQKESEQEAKARKHDEVEGMKKAAKDERCACMQTLCWPCARWSLAGLAAETIALGAWLRGSHMDGGARFTADVTLLLCTPCTKPGVADWQQTHMASISSVDLQAVLCKD